MDYAALFKTCTLTSDGAKLNQLDFICANSILNKRLYQLVEKGTLDYYGVSVPWPIVAALHFRESSQNFHCHLHNGDPLTARTVHVPAGRPAQGIPPFSWVASAIDAFDGLWIPRAWDIPGCLEFMERYNGLGYQKRGVNTPYLWNYTNKYVSGLYVSDGSFDPEKVEIRPGAVAILKRLSEKGVSIDFTGSKNSNSDYLLH